MKRITVFGFALFLSLSCFAQPQPGNMAKEIKLPDAKNQIIALSSLKGKVVLIDFWASWCRPCRQTVPGLKKLYSLYHDKGFEIYGISLDDNPNAWLQAVLNDQSSWIHVNDKSGTVANQWVISVIPTTYLLDKSGKIVAVDEDANSLGKLIPKYLN